MNIEYDVIVVGVGSMGSATCYYLAKSGLKVLGLEQFSLPHEKGSHTGESRFVRMAYFENPDYVPLLRRAYLNWEHLEEASGKKLFHKTGIVYFGESDSVQTSGVRKSSKLHKLPVDEFSNEESKDRFPQFTIPDNYECLFEPNSGFVQPELTINTYVELAKKMGAEIKEKERLLTWEYKNGVVDCTTVNGNYRAKKIIFTAGVWTQELISNLKDSLQSTQQALLWYTPKHTEQFVQSKFSCWSISDPAYVGLFYGFPIIDAKQPTMKIAYHARGIEVQPEEKAEFASSTSAASDSILAVQKGGIYNPVYYKSENLLESMKEPIKTMQAGEIYGPYVDNNAYVIFKLIAAQNIADTVSAQQILINADINNAIQVTNATNKIDSLQRLYRNGISFDSLAIKNSQDATAFNGGDMGILTQLGLYQANPALAQAIFYKGREGDLVKVKSPQGIHLVKINDMVYSDSEPEYKVAFVTDPIVPSQETQNAKSDLVSELILGKSDMESMKAALAQQNVSFQTSAPVKENDFAIDALGSGSTSRDIIKWAYDPVRESGDISNNVYSYQDPVNYYDSKYVIACLKSVNPKGKQTVESIRSSIQPEVMNMKKAETFASSLSVSSLEDLAAEYNATVETAADASLGSPFIPGIGNEPEVVGVAYNTANQAISKPVIGKSGVYVLKPMSKSEAGSAVNLPGIKSNLSSTMKSQVGFRLMESLKEGAKMEDNRSKWF